MRRFAALLMVTLLIMLGCSSIACAAEADDLRHINELVDKTNRKIHSLINEVMAECEDEIGKYLQEVKQVEMGKELFELERTLSELREEVTSLDTRRNDYAAKLDRLTREIDKTKEKMQAVVEKQQQREATLQQEIAERQAEFCLAVPGSKQAERLNKLLADLKKAENKSDEAIAKISHKLDKKIAKIIGDLVDQTNELAAKTKYEGSKKGITVECTMIPVELAGQTIMIDPLRVIAW